MHLEVCVVSVSNDRVMVRASKQVAHIHEPRASTHAEGKREIFQNESHTRFALFCNIFSTQCIFEKNFWNNCNLELGPNFEVGHAGAYGGGRSLYFDPRSSRICFRRLF